MLAAMSWLVIIALAIGASIGLALLVLIGMALRQSWIEGTRRRVPWTDDHRSRNLPRGQLLIDRYGDDALTEAAQRVDQMLADGDSEGRIV